MRVYLGKPALHCRTTLRSMEDELRQLSSSLMFRIWFPWYFPSPFFLLAFRAFQLQVCEKRSSNCTETEHGSQKLIEAPQFVWHDAVRFCFGLCGQGQHSKGAGIVQPRFGNFHQHQTACRRPIVPTSWALQKKSDGWTAVNDGNTSVILASAHVWSFMDHLWCTSGVISMIFHVFWPVVWLFFGPCRPGEGRIDAAVRADQRYGVLHVWTSLISGGSWMVPGWCLFKRMWNLLIQPAS